MDDNLSLLENYGTDNLYDLVWDLQGQNNCKSFEQCQIEKISSLYEKHRGLILFICASVFVLGIAAGVFFEEMIIPFFSSLLSSGTLVAFVSSSDGAKDEAHFHKKNAQAFLRGFPELKFYVDEYIKLQKAENDYGNEDLDKISRMYYEAYSQTLQNESVRQMDRVRATEEAMLEIEPHRGEL